jgi:hypothetical protein
MRVQLAPFWQFIKVNTPDTFDHKFFDFLDINKNASLQWNIFIYINFTSSVRCNYISATKMGHCPRGNYVKRNLPVQIETIESETYYLNGSGKKLSFLEFEASRDPLTWEKDASKMNLSTESSKKK